MHDLIVSLANRRTIVVIEESAAVQELLVHALRGVGHRVLVTRDPREAFELARRVRIDMLVCGLALREQRGPGLIRRLREMQPSLPVLFLAERGPADADAVEDGSTLQTPFSLDEFEEAVTAGASEAAAPRSSTTLTPRQREVLNMLAAGKSTQQISAELGISATTVRNHVANLIAALGAHTRLQAVIAATNAGLIAPRSR